MSADPGSAVYKAGEDFMRWFLTALAATLVTTPSAAQRFSSLSSQQHRSVYVDSGVIRWRDTGREVALFGANYTLPSASDYRAAGYLGLNRKKMIAKTRRHFPPRGWGPPR